MRVEFRAESVEANQTYVRANELMGASKMSKFNSLSVAIAAILANASAAHGFEGRELLLSAPIQHVGAGSVTVLGKDFETSTDGLAIGEVVNIYGVLAADGSMTDTIVEGTSAFGGNGDAVFLKGVVSDTNPALGRVEVDGATIDYTQQLANAEFSPPAQGDVIAIAGSQPLVKGVVLATAFGNNAYTAAMTGGGFRVAAMTGGGVGKAAMTGGGIRSAAMTGGGVGTAAMTGGGVGMAAMTGGGIGTAAMTGGGVGTAAMTGGGIGTAAMTGGGVGTAAMTGGGVGTAAMTGGGVGTAAMTGGGVGTAAMTGGGVASH
jgi:hypothetical protein